MALLPAASFSCGWYLSLNKVWKHKFLCPVFFVSPLEVKGGGGASDEECQDERDITFFVDRHDLMLFFCYKTLIKYFATDLQNYIMLKVVLKEIVKRKLLFQIYLY